MVSSVPTDVLKCINEAQRFSYVTEKHCYICQCDAHVSQIQYTCHGASAVK